MRADPVAGPCLFVRAAELRSCPADYRSDSEVGAKIFTFFFFSFFFSDYSQILLLPLRADVKVDCSRALEVAVKKNDRESKTTKYI